MIYVTGILEEDVWPKIDTQYLMAKFSNVALEAVVVLICTRDNTRKEDRWRHNGETHYAIHLPYEQMKVTGDARPKLLEAIAKRLDVKPAPAL
jgi:hypothetical protein